MRRARNAGHLAVLALVVGLLALVMTQAVACGSNSAGSAATLQVTTPSGTRAFTLKDIKKMPSVEAYGGIKNSAGNITPPTQYKAVTIADLLKSLGGVPAGAGVTFIAKDGYEMTMSADQVNSGKFVTYDVSTGDEITIQDPLQLALAYEVDGKPLNPDTDGTFRVAILSPKANQVTDGHWWVKWVTKVEVKPVVVGWSLALSGAIQDTVDLGSFDSCSAPNCHGVTWKDTNGVTWSGVPLYNLVGRVDDQQKHDNGAFNSALAAQGYPIELFGTAGKTITLDSSRIALTKEYILANKANGKELAGQDAPLRLVGPAVGDSSSLGGITKIQLQLPSK
jgi:DMSO/TMAO reductase YedYZ molybdopterin-dependent catalytic subunit